MERTEPTLVPQWLRCAGNAAGCGTSVHHSDVTSSEHSTQSRSSRSNSEKVVPHFLERSLSSNSRISSNSYGYAKHPYSSFTKSHHKINRDKDKAYPLPEDIWDHDSSDPLASILASRVERSNLKRSQSMISRKSGKVLPHRVEGSKFGVSCQNSGRALFSGTVDHSGIQKAVFEKDFPSLGTEEKPGVTGIKRVLSPGLGSAVQSISIGNSGFLGGEKWTSALAEVPAIIFNNGVVHPPQQSAAKKNSASEASNTAGLNMAEALSQPPPRTCAAPQLSDNSQRLEELAIKQSRKLIPVTPSMPRPLAPGSADKSKLPKIAVRTNEVIVASRGMQTQPYSSHLSYQPRAGHLTSNSLSTSHVGKFLVLKPGRENVASLGTRNASSPTGDANGRIASVQLAAPSPTPMASKSPKVSFVSSLEIKAAALLPRSRSKIDKRLSQSLARSRSEFFSLMRKKTLPSVENNLSESGLAVSSTNGETSGETSQNAPALISSRAMENDSPMTCNGDGHDIQEKIKSFSDVGENILSGNGAIYPDEEEAAFLRSLGWEENSGEDEGLTEAEINAFYQEYMNRMPSLKGCRSSQPTCSTASEFHKAICSESSSS